MRRGLMLRSKKPEDQGLDQAAKAGDAAEAGITGDKAVTTFSQDREE